MNNITEIKMAMPFRALRVGSKYILIVLVSSEVQTKDLVTFQG